MARFRTPTAYAALLSVWFSSIAPAASAGARAAQAGDPAQLLPADTLAYFGWNGVIDDTNAGWLGAIPALVALADDNGEVAARVRHALGMLETAGRGTVGVGLLGFTVQTEESGAGAPTHSVVPEFAIVIDAGQDAAGLADGLRQIIEADGDGALIEDVDVEGVRFVRYDDPHGVYWAAVEGRAIIAGSATAAAKAMRTFKTGETLATAPRHRQILEAGRFEMQPPWVLAGWWDQRGVLDAVKAAVRETGEEFPQRFQDVLTALGLMDIHGGAFQMTATDVGTVQRLFIRAEGRRGVLKLWDAEPLTDAELRMIPQDAYWATASGLDLSKIWQEARAIIEELNPEAIPQVDGGLAAAQAMLGFSITDDLLPAIGDTWIVYDARDHGGVWFTGAALIVETRNPAEVRGVFSRLLQIVTPVLASQQNVTLAERTMQHGQHEITYLFVPGLPIPIAPAVAYVENYAVCALWPQTVQVVLDHLDDPQKKGTILDHPDVAEVRGRLGREMLSFSYYDSDYLMQHAYGLFHMLSTAVASLTAGASPEADPGKLPTLLQVLAQTRSAVSSCRVTEQGILYTSHGSLYLNAISSVGSLAFVVSTTLPSLSRARELAKRAVSASHLRGVGMAVHVWANDHDGKFPESVEQLVAAGLITDEQLASPRGDGPAYVFISGQTINGDPRNIVAYEPIIGDEGTNVVFLDGHSEFVPIPEFKRRLAETYQRLGRENEMPMELRE